MLAILRERLDNRVRVAKDIPSGLPLLATIKFDKTAKNSPVIAEMQSRSLRAESLRQLRTNLQFVNLDEPVQVIVVTSSLPGEGKSSTSTNIAMVFAEAGRRVLLIEADMRRPRVADYLGLERAVGLTNVLAGQVSVRQAIQTWGRNSLHVLPSGSIPPNPSELLGSHAMADLLDELRAEFDLIIIDTPPLLPSRTLRSPPFMPMGSW